MWWLTISLAQAGCDKDTDCKGDRICVEGLCVDPAVPAPNPMLHGPPKLARKHLGASRRRMIAGWSLGGCGSIFGLTAVGLALGGVYTV